MVRIAFDDRSPYARTQVWLPDAANDDLVDLVMTGATDAWPYLRWAGAVFPRRQAPELIYRFARSQMRYRRERDDQLVRLPWRSLSDGVGDCKSMAVLTSALARASACRTRLRFVEYPGERGYGHVYTVADGAVIDPEIPFGDEVDYARGVDVDL